MAAQNATLVLLASFFQDLGFHKSAVFDAGILADLH